VAGAKHPGKKAGDMSDIQSLRVAAKGMERVYHCAALATDWGPREAFRSANVTGVRNLLEASLEAGVNKFIHVSSSDVYGHPDYPADETAPHRLRGWPYSDTKVEAENLVWTCYHQRGLPTTVVRPVTIYRPRSTTLVLQVMQLLKSGRMVRIGKGDKPAGLAYVTNVVDVLLRAADSENSVGQAYNASDGSNVTWRQYVDRLAEIVGVSSPRVVIPYRLAYLTGWTIRGLKKLNLFGFKRAVKRYLNLKPSSFLGRLAGNIKAFAILAGSSTPSFLNRFKQGTQRRIFTKAGDNRRSHADGRLEKSGLGEPSIGNNPQWFSQPFTAFRSPGYKFCGLLKLVLKNYLVFCGHLGHILDSNVHLGQKRQANSGPELMVDHRRDSYPQMAIDKLSPVRRGRGIAMDSCPLDLGPISFCRAIIDSHQDSIVLAKEQIDHHFKQDRRYDFSFPAYGADEIAECFIPPGDTRGPEPTGDGFSAFGQDNSSEEYSQSPGRALMKDAAETDHHNSPAVGKNPFVTHRLSFRNVLFINKHIGRMSHFCL
jgi:nucleoside-diphosphate-sugar epimerase